MSNSARSNFMFVFLIIVLAAIASLMFVLGGEVRSDQYIIRQQYYTGKMDAITKEGWYFKFGYTTEFKVADIIWFSALKDEGEDVDQSIRVRFNDGASANISGSVRFVLPKDPERLIRLKKQFGTFERIKKELVMQVINESIYLTASLMSSKESYTTKRNLFSDYAQDQAADGVFRTTTKEVKTVDPLSGESITRSEIMIMRDADGMILRKKSALREYGIELQNFVVRRISYPENILKQLDEQQQALMDVQKAKAMAQKAEQEAITAEKEGLTLVAKAKAEQEVLKVKSVVEARKDKEVAELRAQKELEVAKLDREAAGEYKEATMLRAEADSKAAKMLIEADGALNMKLATYEKINKYWADAYTMQRPTPDIIIGGDGKKGSMNAAEQMMSLMGIKVMKDLQLDMNVKKK